MFGAGLAADTMARRRGMASVSTWWLPTSILADRACERRTLRWTAGGPKQVLSKAQPEIRYWQVDFPRPAAPAHCAVSCGHRLCPRCKGAPP